MIVDSLKEVTRSKDLTINLTNNDRDSIFKSLSNHKKLPQKIANDYALHLGKTLIDSDFIEGLKWTVKSQNLQVLDRQIVSKIIKCSGSFTEFSKNVRKIESVEFGKHTANTKLVCDLLEYEKVS